MYKDIFTQIGLSDNEAIVYEFLIKNGEVTAGDIIKKTPLKRGVVYNALENLRKKGAISKKTKNKVSYFTPQHPERLRKYAEEKENEIKKAERNLEANMPKLISDFNLVSGQPGIRIYEGREGLVKVLNDSLNSKTEILTYAQIKGMEKYLGRDNDKYVRKRKELKIKKRGIVADTPYARKYLKNYDRSVTEIRLIDGKKYPIYLEMEIYDGKVSFLTFSEKKLIGVIIENKEIYESQRSIFELVWANATPFPDKTND
jgi:sugar-specific transcriptional regulator TrmB